MIWEDPECNWRRSYHEGIAIKIDDLKRERAAQVKRRIYIDDRAYAVRDLTDSQIESFARREAERDINRAIIERDRATALMRARRGQAA